MPEVRRNDTLELSAIRKYKGYSNQEGTMESKKQPWEPMQLTYVGHAAEIVQAGGGKLSTIAEGDGRKGKGEG
jgi:hypothetical protein